MNKFELFKKDFLNSLTNEQKEFLQKLCFYSKCLCDFVFRDEKRLFYLYENLDKPLLGKEKLLKETKSKIDINLPEHIFIQELTKFKMLHFGRILSKDIYGKNSLPDLMEEYSYLADATIEIAFNKAFEEAKKRYGIPKSENGEGVNASVIALGKLGGLELNYYSDIDIMYIYSEEGKTDKGVSNREFFSYMFTKLTNYLSKKNIEGQSWIVDLDLRPNGRSGFISYSLPALEVYYWTTGRVWERHMLMKARHSAGDKEVSDEFIKMITPFVYRKTIIKEELKEIIEMKKLIEQDAKKSTDKEVNIKTCDGGIREIEFTAQILQLVYGGKNNNLREKSTYKAIQKLQNEKIISQEDAEKLKSGYLFLRKLEHLIQVENCIQTQVFKYQKAEDYAKKMGYASTDKFWEDFEKHRKNISQIFNSLQIGEAKELSPLQKYIFTKHNQEEAISYLNSIGCKKPEWVLDRIKDIFLSKEFVYLTNKEKEILFEFLPKLEEKLKQFPDKEDFLLNLNNILIKGKFLPLFASSLKQNENLANFILKVAEISDYISSLMAKDPSLLDFVFSSLNKALETEDDFEKELNLIKEQDFITKLNKLKNLVEITAIFEYLSNIDKQNSLKRLKKLNKVLTNLADFIIKKINSKYNSQGLCIFSLGKLGSKEMNIGSDLDLIFVFDSLENKNQYQNVPVNIIRDLTKYTKEGILYQIDLRLRPYGKAGELAPSISFYEKYFQNEARSWERLAWTKARYITGDAKTRKEFSKIIENFLYSKPITEKFIEEVAEMRFRLEGFTNEKPDEIDIKLGYGGLADVEFAVQLFCLKNKIKETSILETLVQNNVSILNDYIFLREVETRFRMIKGTGISRISKSSKNFYRVAVSFNKDVNTLWEEIKVSREKLRQFFLRTIKTIKGE